MQSLLNRLRVQSKNSIEPLFSLLEALVRDISADFLSYLPETLLTFHQIIDEGIGRNPEILNLMFTCLARIFKTIRKELLMESSGIMETTRFLRLHKSKYVRSLTVQAMSVVYRNATLPQLAALIQFLVQEVSSNSGQEEQNEIAEANVETGNKEDVRYESGGTLLAETVRGPAHGLNSRASNILNLILDPNSELAQSEKLFKLSEIMFEQICSYGRRGRLGSLWDILFMGIWKNLDSENFDENMKHLLFHLKIMSNIISFHGGSLVENYVPIFEILERCVQILPSSISREGDWPQFQKIFLEIMLHLCDSHNLSAGASAGPENFASRVSKWKGAFKYFSMNNVTELFERLNQRAQECQPAALCLLKVLIPDCCERIALDEFNFGLVVLSDSCLILFKHLYVKIDFLSQERILGEIILQRLESQKFDCFDILLQWGLIRIAPFCLNHDKCSRIIEDTILNALHKCESALQSIQNQNADTQNENADTLSLCRMQAGLESLMLIKKAHTAQRLSHHEDITMAVRVANVSLHFAGPIMCAANLIRVNQDKPNSYIEYIDDMNIDGLNSPNRHMRCAILDYLCALQLNSDEESWVTVNDILSKLCDLNSYELQKSSGVLSHLKRFEVASRSISRKISTEHIPDKSVKLLTAACLGTFHLRLTPIWEAMISALGVLLNKFSNAREVFLSCLQDTHLECLAQMNNCDTSKNLNKKYREESKIHTLLISKVNPTELGTTCWIRLTSLMKILSKNSYADEMEFKKSIASVFLLHMNVENMKISSEWKELRREWLRVLLSSFCGGYSLLGTKESSDIYAFLMRMIGVPDQETACLAIKCLGEWNLSYLGHDFVSCLQMIATPTQLKDGLRILCFDENSSFGRPNILIISKEIRPKIVPVVVQILLPQLLHNSFRKSSLSRAAYDWLSELSSLEILPLMSDILSPLFSSKTPELKNILCEILLQQRSPDDLSRLLKLHHGELQVKSSLIFFRRLEDTINAIGSHVFEYLHAFIPSSLKIISRASVLCEGIARMQKLDQCMDCKYQKERNIKRASEISHESIHHGNTEMKGVREVRTHGLRALSTIFRRYPNFDFECYCTELIPILQPLALRLLNECNVPKPPPALQIIKALSSHDSLLVLLGKIDRSMSILKFVWRVLQTKVASKECRSLCFEILHDLLASAELQGKEHDNIAKSLLREHSSELFESLKQVSVYDDQAMRRHHNSSTKTISEPTATDKMQILTRLSLLLHDNNSISALISSLIIVMKTSRLNESVTYSLLSAFSEIVAKISGSGAMLDIDEYWLTIIPLFARVKTSSVRSKLLEACHALASKKESLIASVRILDDIHSKSAGCLQDIDYDTCLGAYEKIEQSWYKQASHLNIRAILFQSLFDLRNSDFAIRNCASNAIQEFILLNKDYSEMDNKIWSTVLLPGIKALFSNPQKSSRDTAITLLGFAASKAPNLIPEVAMLYRDDPEKNFFTNIIHLQSHRRSKALNLLEETVKTDDHNSASIEEYFMSLLLLCLKEPAQNVVSSAISVIKAISAKLPWENYKNLLRKLLYRSDKQNLKMKAYIRTIASVLENLGSHHDRVEEVEFQSVIKYLFPRMEELLPFSGKDEQEEAIVSPTSILAFVHFMKHLPDHARKVQLNRILKLIIDRLASRSQGVRDYARKAITNAVSILGISSLQVVLETLRTRLARGFQVHVLSIVMHDILHVMAPVLSSHEVDELLPEIVPVLEMDIFGIVAQERDVYSIAATYSEARRTHSFDSFTIIAMRASFPDSLPLLLSPVMRHMDCGSDAKVNRKIEGILTSVQKGILSKAEIQSNKILRSAQSLILHATTYVDKATVRKHMIHSQENWMKDLMKIDDCRNVQNYQSLVIFALSLVKGILKVLSRDSLSEDMRNCCYGMLEEIIPEIIILLNFRSSKIVSLCLQILACSLKLKVFTHRRSSDALVRRLLVFINNSHSSESHLEQDCLRLIANVLQCDAEFSPTNAQCRVIIDRCLDNIQKNNTCSLLSCSTLRALLTRRPLISDIYDGMDRICCLTAIGSTRELRRMCSQVILQFLLDYPLGARKVQHYLEILLINLKCEQSEGRVSIICAIHALILKFPKAILYDIAEVIFLPLVVQLGSDKCTSCRISAGESLIALLKRVDSSLKVKFLLWMEKWFIEEENMFLRQTSLQVIGIIIQICPQDALCTLENIWPDLNMILGSNYSSDNGSWSFLYKTLLLIEKVSGCTPDCLPFIASRAGETISLVMNHLGHAHQWIQASAVRILRNYLRTEVYETSVMSPENVHNMVFHNLENVTGILEKLLLIYEFNYNCSEATLKVDLLREVAHNISKIVTQYLWLDIPCSELKSDHELKVREGVRFVRRVGRYCVISKNSLREICIRCIAGILAEVKTSTLINYPEALCEIILPCYICIDPTIKGVSLQQRELALEVLQLTRTLVSESQFNAAYAKVRSTIQEKRASRKIARKSKG
jgi:U3 small nucleolar RNA-associated protein 20